MKIRSLRAHFLLTACCSFLSINAFAAPPKRAPFAPSKAPTKAQIAARAAVLRAAQAKEIMASLRKTEAALAGDASNGRGSASDDELRAARTIAAELKRFGVAPAGQNGGFLQRVPLASVAQPGQLNDADAKKTTTNVVGILRGSDKNASREAILLTAHLDHLGVGRAVGGDSIYNGADDDASGVAAVLELARIISRGPRPRRTIVFALFGSEEIGGFGATYFHTHTPIPLANTVANLEFEMIGRPDGAVAPRTLWLTGYERSDLGAALAAHGARLVADPHPQQNFFARSDNYGLAKQGVIAHTVSSFNLHRDYHQPSDDIAHLDFAHMTDAIQSFLAPVLWLCNSNFKPMWKPGQRP